MASALSSWVRGVGLSLRGAVLFLALDNGRMAVGPHDANGSIVGFAENVNLSDAVGAFANDGNVLALKVFVSGGELGCDHLQVISRGGFWLEDGSHGDGCAGAFLFGGLPVCPFHLALPERENGRLFSDAVEELLDGGHEGGERLLTG
jgi:hypothetical protein